MHPFSFIVVLWDALVNRYFIYLSPIDGGKNDSPLFRRRIVETKKKGKNSRSIGSRGKKTTRFSMDAHRQLLTRRD